MGCSVLYDNNLLGVQCDANTFDGERCLYGALTDQIRHLLQNFHVISSETMRRDKYREFLRRSFELSDYSDIQFIIEKEVTSAHHSILACRSKFFLHSIKSLWKDRTFIDLTNLNISVGIFKSLIQYLYMGQVSIDKKEIEIFITLAEHFCINSLVTEIKKVSQSNKNHSVSYLQPQSQLQQEFSKLFLSSLPTELQPVGTTEEPLFVDLHIKIENYIFLCHKVFICGRCSYLQALVTDHFAEASVCDDCEIQVITLHDTDPKIFVKILQYIYTNTVDISSEYVLDVLCLADIFILPGLKKLCASVIEESLTTDNIIPLFKISRLYNLSRLEDHCTEFMAEHLEEIINQADFSSIILDDAKEIKNREEVDTISVIDDIRYHIDRSERVSNNDEKHLLIARLLYNLKLEA